MPEGNLVRTFHYGGGYPVAQSETCFAQQDWRLHRWHALPLRWSRPTMALI